MGPGSNRVWKLGARRQAVEWIWRAGEGPAVERWDGEQGMGLGVLRPRGTTREHPGPRGATSEEAAVFEVLLDDNVGDSVEDKLDVLCVGGARHVGIDLLHVASHVELEELHLDVTARVLICVGPWRGRGSSHSR